LTRRIIATVVAAAAVVAVGSAQQSGSRPNGYAVNIEVFATDARGRTIDTLTAADFELREDGVPQTLDSVRFAHDAGRMFAIFLDEYHVSPANTDRVRAALTRFVDAELTARDAIVVLKPLDSLLTIKLTADRDAARAAIQSFAGRKGDFTPRNSYEQNFMAGTPARIGAARAQVAWSAVNALAVHLGALGEGRKTLIVVSEGVAAAERRRGQEFLPTRETAIRSANRSNVAIYTVDPGDSAAVGADADAVRSLAAETDGESIAADLDAGLRKAAAHSSGYYFLHYTSSHVDDGRFHEVQVSAKKTGVRVHARKGFTAPSTDDVLRTALLKQLNEPKPVVPIEPAPHVSPLIRPWFGLTRGAEGRSRVTFVWEPAARVPGDTSARRHPARVLMTALAPDGTVLFEGPVAATGPAVFDEPGGIPARATFDAPPGRLRLRLAIQDVTAQVLDLDVRDLIVREQKDGVGVGTPEVLRARNAREFRTLAADTAVPVASREFSRTERLLVRFQAYGPTGAEPQVSARLLTRMGQPMRDLPVAAGSSREAEHAIDLPLANLASGDYILEVEARGPAGDVKDRVGFRVTP
jgi:VWFA-related protein